MVWTRWWHFFFQPAPVGFVAMLAKPDESPYYQRADDHDRHSQDIANAQIWPTAAEAIGQVEDKVCRWHCTLKAVIRVGPQVCAEWCVKDVERVVWSDLKDHPSNLGLGHNSRK